VKILLVSPMVSKVWKPYAILPFGLCSLKAAVENTTEHEARVLDASGMTLQEVRREIARYKPNVVGVTTFTESRHNALDIARLGHEFGATTILGGAHASNTSQQILSNYTFVDAVCKGEGERAFSAWLSNFTREPSFPVIQDLDELPFPDFSDLDLGRYVNLGFLSRGEPLMVIEASRGCPYGCTFCSSIRSKVRYKSVDRVIKELELLKEKYNSKLILFLDDIFTMDKARTQELCRRMLGLGIVWIAQTRVDCVDKETFVAMWEAGCRIVGFGVESASQEVLGPMGKRQSKEEVINAFALCREVGFETVFNLIVGCPGETKETLEETRQLVRECKPTRLGANELRAYPGTKIWELGVNGGLFTDDILLSKQERIYYEGVMSFSQMYKELIRFRLLLARLRGMKGWIELLKVGLRVIRSGPSRVLKGVFG